MIYEINALLKNKAEKKLNEIGVDFKFHKIKEKKGIKFHISCL
jgi:hypothetical protein